LFGVTNINKIKIKTEHTYYFCLDNDRAGTETIAKYSHLDNIYKVEMVINGKLINGCKDWNELIVKFKQGGIL
jgi:DNA primase